MKAIEIRAPLNVMNHDKGRAFFITNRESIKQIQFLYVKYC